MKLIISIIHDEDARFVVEGLNKRGFQATKLASTGGFLRQGNTTVLVGCEDEKVEDALEIIKENAKTRTSIAIATNNHTASEIGGTLTAVPYEVTVGGATVFVVPIEQFIKF